MASVESIPSGGAAHVGLVLLRPLRASLIVSCTIWITGKEKAWKEIKGGLLSYIQHFDLTIVTYKTALWQLTHWTEKKNQSVYKEKLQRCLVNEGVIRMAQNWKDHHENKKIKQMHKLTMMSKDGKIHTKHVLLSILVSKPFCQVYKTLTGTSVYCWTGNIYAFQTSFEIFIVNIF